jgi:hypothetical protein
MPEREIDRRRERARAEASPSPLQRAPHPVLALQRMIGNHAVAQMLARAPATRSFVHLPGVGDIKVTGGNLGEWAAGGVPETVDLSSRHGKHSAKLEKLAGQHTKADVKVTISAETKVGEELNVGGGTTLEITGARVKGYAVEGGEETWQLADFSAVHRTKVSHKVS